MYYHGDADVAGGDAELAGQDDGGEGEGAAHVYGGVVAGHGEGAVAGEEFWNEAEADGVLRGLGHGKANAEREQLPEGVDLRGNPGKASAVAA